MRLAGKRKSMIRISSLLMILVGLSSSPSAAQRDNNLNDEKAIKEVRKLGLGILRQIKSTLKKEYYDPNFHGIDLEQRFKAAEERIGKLETYPQIYRAIGQVVSEFNDSHTNFFPPRMNKTADYGFSWQMIGDRCYVVDVKKGSDAEAKGLRVGDIITGITTYNPTRENIWLMSFLFYRLDPKERLKIFLAAPGGSERELLIESKIIERKERFNEETTSNAKPYRCQEINADLITCKLYTFVVATTIIDSLMKEVRKHKQLILDLRGNSGGYVATEMYLTGFFFPRDVKIADLITRKKTEERIAKTRKEKFTGDFIVLIDSKSYSASEVFARVIQLEKRGQILGDVSAGKVMTSVYFPLYVSDPRAEFVLSVTVGDLIMTDGQSLEGVGVVPDEIVLPNGFDLAEGTDPALSRAATLLGAQLTPAEAGKLSFLRSQR